MPLAIEMSEKHDGGQQVSASISPVNEDSRMTAAVEIMASVASGYGEASSNPFQSQEAAHQAYHDTFYGHGQVMSAGRESSEHAFTGEEAEGSEANDGDENGPIKLFVGQVPRSMSEEDLFSTFTWFGPIKELMIIRDRHTGQHRGCAFVTFYKTSDGLQAIEDLHDKVTLMNGRKPLQVRPANEGAALSTPLQENKLFVGMTARNADENALRELFDPFGELREIYLIRNADGSNKGCAFLKFAHAESAMAAIEALNDKVVMEGASRPLIVKYADTRAQKKTRQGVRGRGQHFYHPPAYSMYGYQQQTGQGPPMGVPPPVQYTQPYSSAPFTSLGNPTHYDMYGMPRGPAYGYPASAPFSSHGGVSPIPPGSGGSSEGYDGLPGHSMQHNRDAYSSSPRPREGPAGANLFIYHLPHDLTDADLATAFNPFGQVISAKVYVDKYTRESKGFGFVSYDSMQAAEAAIEQMNGFQIGSKRLKVQHKRIHSSNRMPQYMESMLPHEGGPIPMMPSLHHDTMGMPIPHYHGIHLEDPDTLTRRMEHLNVNQFGEEE